MGETHELGFQHVYEPGEPGSATLLLLHGTGGNEHDLLPLRRMLLPGAGVLSPLGKVLENGMPRFFRRLAEGVFDVEDLKRRTLELAEFVAAAAERYAFDPERVIATGFSNGANIAASLLLMKPNVLSGAILFRAMVPFEPDTPPSLPRTPVFLSSGARDPLVPLAGAKRLTELLQRSGAQVTWHQEHAGHELTRGDIDQARTWLAATIGAGKDHPGSDR